MAEFNLDNIQPRAEHFDLLVPPERLLCWGFQSQRLREVYGYIYRTGVFKSLLESLKEISESKNRRTRERRFTIWSGEYLDSLWIGVPASLSTAVVEILDHHLQRVGGCHTLEYGYAPSLQFTAFFMYDHGRVIEYSDDSVAGQERNDPYGSGVMVIYRLLW